MKIVDEIKKSVTMEIRPSPDPHEYFEAIVMSEDMVTLTAILEKNLGEPLKPAGRDVRFAADVQKIVDLIGGLRREQSFYLKNENNGKFIYAALWPWQSDSSRVTLKIGVYGVNESAGE